jgi:Tfp pilus assembly protein PilX
MKKNMKIINKNRQQGVALAIGMLLLLVVSVIGVTSMKSAMLQAKMASGVRHHELADAAALSLLVEVERWIFNWYNVNNGTELVTGSHGIIDIEADSALAHSFRIDRDLNDGFEFQALGGHTITSQFVSTKTGVTLYEEPKYIIENLTEGVGNVATGEHPEGGPNSASSEVPVYYRIVTKAVDDSGKMFSAFESTISASY